MLPKSNKQRIVVIGGLCALIAFALLGWTLTAVVLARGAGRPVADAPAEPADSAAAVVAVAPASQPAATPEPLELHGVGPFVTGTIHVPVLMRIVMTNSGLEHFSVQSVAEDGSMRALYANDSGTPFDGSAAIAPGDHILQIDSESTWTIRIEPLNADRGAAAGSSRPEPTPEATPEATPEPTPKPTQIPIVSATGPPNDYYRDVRSKLMTLNAAMIELVDKTAELKKNPSAAHTGVWRSAWAAKGAAVLVAADSVQGLQRWQGGEALLDDVTAAADDAREAVDHLARAIDAGRAGDTATNEAELAEWERTKASFRQHVITASDLIP